MVQLLAPFAVTIVFYIAWCILWVVLDMLFHILRSDNPYNIFDFENNAGYAAAFWIINVILIIIAEIIVTSVPEDEFQ